MVATAKAQSVARQYAKNIAQQLPAGRPKKWRRSGQLSGHAPQILPPPCSGRDDLDLPQGRAESSINLGACIMNIACRMHATQGLQRYGAPFPL